MKKREFNKIIDEGIARERLFLAVKIINKDNPTPEIIINHAASIPQKRKYYNQAYNDNLELISALNAGKHIQIEDVLVTSNLNDLKWFAY